MEQRTDKFLVYIEEFDILKELSDEEIGRFFRALIEFVRTGETPVLDEKLIFAFRFVTAHILRDQKKYREVSEKRSIAGKKGQEVKHLKNAEKEPFRANDEDVKKEILQLDAENEENEAFQVNDEITEKEPLGANDEDAKKEILQSDAENEENEAFQIDDEASEKDFSQGNDDFCEKSGSAEICEKNIKSEKGDFSAESKMVTSGEKVEKGDFSADTYGINKKVEAKRKRLTKKFDEFWERYPQKKNKKTALKAYFDLNPTEELHIKILEALDIQKRAAEWTREGGRFVPHPAKWITCRRWEDCYKKDETKNKSESTLDLECSFDVDEFYKAAFEKSQRERGKGKFEN